MSITARDPSVDEHQAPIHPAAARRPVHDLYRGEATDRSS